MSAFWDYQLRQPAPAKRAEPRPKPQPRRRRWLLAAVALLALLIGVGVYGKVRGRGSLARVQQLRQELTAARGRGVPAEQQKATAEQFRQEVRKLSPEQRSELFAAGRREAMQRLDAYFAMSPAERRQYLDREIDRAEQRRREANNNPAGGPGANGRRPGGERPRSAEEIEKRRREMLNRTTPEQRAQMDQFRARMDKFRQEMNQRRSQRGLPPATGPGGFGPR
jgi:cell division protein FtsB